MKVEFLPCNLKYLAVACKRSNSDVGALIKGLYAYFTESKKQTYENEGMQMLYDLFVDDLEDFLATKKKQSDTNSNNACSKNGSGKSKNPKQKKGKSVTTVANDSVDEDSDDGNATSGDDSSDDGDAVVADDNDSSVSSESAKPPEVANEMSDNTMADTQKEVANETSDTVNAQLSFDFATESSDRSETEQNATVTPDSAKDNAIPTFEKIRDVYNKTGDNETQARELWQRLSDENRCKALAYAESIVTKAGYRPYLFVFLRDKEWTKKAAK